MKQIELQAMNFKQSLPVVYEDLEPFLMAELNLLRDKLISLPDSTSSKEILYLFESCVLSLNNIENNEEIDSTIDTEEREGLCDALYKMGTIVGLDETTEYIDNWREW
ncbi:hypothetical protein SAMN05421820_101834 [Pedobacter steynii]|uniref:Uncharacterized protein n=1 Tax=Pedobacter steynii TaxID=430522 RepID=A0A1G9LBU2_9SPHI|nr:hypothetical protein [Pedobacter steynii]NQX38799.1 hypothetical protein [Pedobacter steynii]SDL59207.1 hypothetical protein SAMN05421820_101834 [Pedobacter steynii]